jgi:hypothetical protein
MIGAHNDARKASDFARVHAFARSAADIPGDQDARLVVLPAEHVYTKRTARVPRRSQRGHDQLSSRRLS